MRSVARFNEYTVEQGWSDDLANELVGVSLEPTIQIHTSHDAEYRFRDFEAASDWYNNPEKLPTTYSLRDDTTRELGGFAWFSRQQHPRVGSAYQATFAIRLYDSTRGKRLSYPFAVAAHEDFLSFSSLEDISGIWLETNNQNVPAHRLYQRLGYHVLVLADNRVVMGIKTEQTKSDE